MKTIGLTLLSITGATSLKKLGAQRSPHQQGMHSWLSSVITKATTASIMKLCLALNMPSWAEPVVNMFVGTSMAMAGMILLLP